MVREWDIKRTTFSLGDFMSWQKAGSLELSPSFQRRSVWTKPQKSYFVDTVYRGLPVPIIFLRERTDIETLSTIREVVDGQQRLRTLLAFADMSSIKDADERDEFLVQKKHNPDISDKVFAKLSSHEKKRIISYQFSVHVLPSDTGDNEVLSIFARMNSTGSKLNDQELRNAEFFGDFKILSFDIAHENLNRWRKWKIFSEQDIARMKEVEFTSTIFIFLMDGIFERTQSNINKYYKRFDENFLQKASISKQFSEIMENIEDSFGESISTSVYSNSAMFLQLVYLIKRFQDEKISLSRYRVRSILSIGENIKNRKGLPEEVSVALSSRFNRVGNQKIVSEYIYSNVTI